MNRRTFLRRAGGALVAAVAAPLFIPADRLEFGVPRPIARPDVPTIWSPQVAEAVKSGVELTMADFQRAWQRLKEHDDWAFEQAWREMPMVYANGRPVRAIETGEGGLMIAKWNYDDFRGPCDGNQAPEMAEARRIVASTLTPNPI